MENNTHDYPCAANGLVSYRYNGALGFIMIGAMDHQDALNEANRSLTSSIATIENLEIWNVFTKSYESVKQ